MKLERRMFLAGAAAGAATLAAPAVWGAGGGKPKVVVIGGGAGGATAARYIAKDGKGEIDVTLIEPTRTYYTCFFSNLYLGGIIGLGDIGHTYARLASDYGINVVHDIAIDVDRAGRTVTTAGGDKLAYDRLVISPGIDFIEGSVPGWDVSHQDEMPHAYKAGTQTALLKHQVENMREGGVFAMVAPPNPYRCPPGPYERVSMVAKILSEKNPTAKILILDPKPKFSKQALFEEGWQNHYPGMIERIGPDFGGDKVEVRPDAMEVVVDGEVNKVDVCNVIPAQKAGWIVHRAGLTEGNWAPVRAEDMASRKDEAVHILGDASAQGDMPKSGFSANSQAKVCANAVVAALGKGKKFPARFSNTCWSTIYPEDGIKVGATYKATPEKIAKVDGFISKTGESADVRKATYEESFGWYAGITKDMFG
ncbi:MAG: NAD(P)/FAD-dependent oxidoreductase [Alphaproteobacteria bacterium]|nr:MAG: NAD(P)/FAD-dependent oxidoreductase [Alphaproteobacteria bacterium]